MDVHMTTKRLVIYLFVFLACPAGAFATPTTTDKTAAKPVAAPMPQPVTTASTQQATPAPVLESSIDRDMRELREQITAAPADALLQVRLGYLLLKKGAPDEARLSFAEALKINPRSHAALTGEGIVLADKGNYREAEQTLKAALAQNPNPVRTHYELGVVYEKLGDFEKAVLEYKEGIKKHQQGRK